MKEEGKRTRFQTLVPLICLSSKEDGILELMIELGKELEKNMENLIESNTALWFMGRWVQEYILRMKKP